MARFFIDRPIFAWVIAIIIMLAGGLAVVSLPVSQYPTIAPPSVTINATYPGASAKVVEDSVTQIIEQSMTGLDGLLYMSATSEANGRSSLTLTFDNTIDADTAQVQVQNKLQLAMALMPQEVQRQGVMVSKARTGFLMVVGFVSNDGSMGKDDISDYVAASLVDPISRVPGVGGVQVFGAKYAMRIWLDPNKLTTYKVSTADIIAAVNAQNAQVAVGQLGGTPAVAGQQLNATITAQSRLQTAEQFRDIVVRANPDGSVLRLADVARVEIGAENYDYITRFNGKPATGVAISLATGANALDTAAGVKAKLDELKAFFPAGLDVVIPFDTTPFVRVSIIGVVMTLIEAIVLVFLVMYLFLQNFRATLIPTIAVPVVLLGTFGVLSVMGFSINMLTMFAMVLAIGLLVDDAIVVVENVERIMEEEGLSPLEATRKSMDQITGALVGIGLVLSAVFVPMAFMSGSTGIIYRQFSITIVSAMALSVLVALILTPALCVTLLKHKEKVPLEEQKGFFGWFNRFFDRLTHGYVNTASGTVSRPVRMTAVYVGMLVILAVLYVRMPTSFLPTEDQGVLLTLVQLPEGATMDRTVDAMEQMRAYFETEDGVESVFHVAGFSFAGQGQNMGMAFVKLKDWSERTDPKDSASAIIARAWGGLSQITDATIFPINLPAIPGLGVASGFNLQLQDRNNLGHEQMVMIRNQLLGMAAQDPRLAQVRPNGMPDVPIFRIDIDYEKVKSLGVSVADVNQTLSTAWGGSYVNDFIDRGRIKKVYMQADAEYRMMPEDINQWYVRNNQGEMVPFSAFTSTRWDFGSPRLERYNGVPSLNVQGEAAPGLSTGDAMIAMEELISQLPAGVGYEWTGMSFQERLAGAQTPMLLSLSLLVVFLCLAALYESWSVPFSVMLIVPLGVLGAILAAYGRNLSNDVYFQVGLLATIGLSSKNAILIVEFAKMQVDEGKELIAATLEAARMRLRPIIMTSMAFILGVTPLALSTGAGAVSRQAIGTGVIGGVLAATFLAIFFVPLFFVLVMKISHRISGKPTNN